MSVLFYIVRAADQVRVQEYCQFISEFSKYVDENIVIIDESEDKTMVWDSLAWIENKTLYRVDDLLARCHLTDEEKGGLRFDNYLNFIDPGFKKGGIPLPEYVDKLFTELEKIMLNHHIRAAHLCTFFNMFRTVGGVILQEVASHRQVPLYMIHKSFCKGRYTIYQSIYFKDKNTEKSYEGALKTGLDVQTREDLDRYLQSYISFTDTTHVDKFKKKRAEESRLLKTSRIATIVQEKISGIKKGLQRNPNRPYILFLMNKADHWISSFANPELYDRNEVIRRIWLSTPSSYDLVLKPHPTEQMNVKLEAMLQKMPNCYIDFQTISSVGIVKGAAAVIFSGTTSVMVALACKKHVIELGAKSIYFDFQDPPAKRVVYLGQLRQAVTECLEQEPPVKKIYAYFHALLENSYTLNEESNEIRLHPRGDISTVVAHKFIDRLKVDGILNPL